MYLARMNRAEIFRFLPENGVIAEIGTAQGDFAVDILIHSKPTKLHLIDPWEHQNKEDYLLDPSNIDQMHFEERFEKVQEKFSGYISSEVVELHRTYSPEAAKLFPDSYFDYIYVDGMHTEEAVYADLVAFDQKVKNDGLIIGHDYVASPLYRERGFGVVEAVNRFIKETGYEFSLLTNESCPTYVLSKDVESTNHKILMSKIISDIPMVVEIGNPENKIMTQRHFPIDDGDQIRTIIGFQ